MKSLVFLAVALLIGGCATTAKPEVKESKTDPRCLQKGETGKCRGFFTHFYFDATSGSCKPFVWGGCEGVVPFKTMKSCKTTCL